MKKNKFSFIFFSIHISNIKTTTGQVDQPNVILPCLTSKEKAVNSVINKDISVNSLKLRKLKVITNCKQYQQRKRRG